MQFKAVTLKPERGVLSSPIVWRSRSLQTINRPPVLGPIAFISGPLGSGKTILAMQWAQQHGKSIHYISTRPSADIPESWVEEPDELGLAFARLLDSCGRFRKEPSESEILANLKRVVSLAEHSSQCVILDDLELLQLAAIDIMLEELEVGLSIIATERLLLVSRVLDSNMINFLQSTRSIRLVLPTTLRFDAKEAEEAQRIGVFGSRSLP